MFNRLFILVEGNDDERFFENIVVPLLENEYDHIKIWKYAQKKHKDINNFLSSINAMRADYIFVTDLDEDNCVIQKRIDISNVFNNINNEKILIVIKEIESWYLAGLVQSSIDSLELNYNIENTENLSKEDFNKLIPDYFDSRIDFMQEILKCFNFKAALGNNQSIKYLYDKYIG